MNSAENDHIDLLEKAKELISDYFCEEFEDIRSTDFDDLSCIGVAYTTSEDEESNDLQAYVDLINYRIVKTFNGIIAEVIQYSTIEELIKEELEYMDFNWLVTMPDPRVFA